MKKTVAILLLFTLFINVAGYHLLFYLVQWQVKLEVKNRLRLHIDSEAVDYFTFNSHSKTQAPQPEWEGDDEFRLNGEMYDVIEKHSIGDTIFVSCISDKKETLLIKKYQEIEKNDFGSKKKSFSMIKLMGTLYTKPEPPYQPGALLSAHVSFADYHFQIPVINSEVITPPPRS